MHLVGFYYKNKLLFVADCAVVGLNPVYILNVGGHFGGLTCTICYPCATYTSSLNRVLCMRGCVTLFFEAHMSSYIFPYLIHCQISYLK